MSEPKLPEWMKQAAMEIDGLYGPSLGVIARYAPFRPEQLPDEGQYDQFSDTASKIADRFSWIWGGEGDDERFIFMAGASKGLEYNSTLTHEELKRVKEELVEAKQNSEELNRLFELQYTRMTEATALWRKENPGNDLVLPDLGYLLKWLMDRKKDDAGMQEKEKN